MREQTTTEPFVVRRTGLGTTTSILYLGGLLVALEVLLTLVCVVVALVRDEPVRGPLEAVWLSWSGMPLIFAIGLPILVLVGAITTTESRSESDSDDVLLCIDSERVYLGGDQPQTLPWDQVHGICRVERPEVDTVDTEGTESWSQHLIVITHPDSELTGSTKSWGPSRLWPGTFEVMGKPLDFDALAEAVKRHAPHIPVTDRGRVPE
ncbi:hypothetical protein [Streptomyces sp. SID13031]|uniref:hypothetical protein n=1 Tax=Streptomyces sp. SID13031 TaxID=2706046 RepID=UPI0013CC4443|nr:hypothetical protein [Streptomyces sp. SID13031]NEA35769.1 hypothetical protein [Streptomyces sp. SID13031]